MDSTKIEEIVERFTEGTDMFLVEIKCSASNDIEVVIDSDTSVSIDTCVELSRAIDAEFDREAEDFELSVMSAGVGQPLKLIRQYQKAVGKAVEVVTTDGMKYTGVLERVQDEAITLGWQEKQLIEGKKRKELVEMKQEIPMDAIKATKVQVSFK